MVLDFFRELSAVPRGSQNNTKISNYLVDFAKERGLRYIQDELDNVVIYKPAAKGYENCPPLIIQGHMDMVCEKVSGSEHDFENEGIEIIEDGKYLTANGTTLGADDGIAMAYMLEFLDDKDMVCPPMEMVFTTDEEIGMIGAIAFDASVLSGKCMINVDSEEESGFIVACAGGRAVTTDIKIKRETVNGVMVEVVLSGLKGGHSGTEIDKNRSNAVILLGRLLAYLPDGLFKLLDINGGHKDNVIPNEATARFVVPADKLDEFSEIVSQAAVIISDELVVSEPDLEINITEDDPSRVFEYEVFDDESYARIFYYLTYVPNGIQVMNAGIKGMVESSQNLGTFKTFDTTVSVTISLRSQKPTYKDYMTKKLEGLANMIDADFTVSGDYPGYDMTPESQFRDTMCEAYKETFGREPVISGIHAGLEIGVFSSKIPGLDIISIGPDTYDIHTVDEKVDTESVDRVEKFLRNAVAAYAEKNK